MSHRTPARALTLVLFISLTALSFGETLRVPQDYSLIQRAIWAADPGDTIEIAEGTYVENVVATKPLTIRGAVSGKTILAGKDRASPVLALNAKGGSITAANLVLRHEPAPELPMHPNSDEPPTEYASDGLALFNGTLSLKNITVENSSGAGVTIANGTATVENVIVAHAGSHGVSLYKTLPGTKLSGITVSDAKGFDLNCDDAAADFRKLHLDGKGSGIIQAGGPQSNVTFPDLSKEQKEKIVWGEGVSGEGPVPKKEGEVTLAEEEQMDPYSEHRQAERDEYQLSAEPSRRQLARDLQSALKDKKDAAGHAAALGVYFKALLETYQNGETADFGVDEAISAEVRHFYQRFGAQALLDAIPTWPKYAEVTAQFDYPVFLLPEMQLGYEKALGANWVKANSAKLDEFFAAWKKEKAADPAACAAAFLKGVQQTAELLNAEESGVENVQGSVRDYVIAEVNRLIAQAGYPTLNQLLRQLAATEDNRFITAPDIQAALTPEQKRELFKAMRTGATK